MIIHIECFFRTVRHIGVQRHGHKSLLAFSLTLYRVLENSKSKDFVMISAVLLNSHRSHALNACNFHDTSIGHNLTCWYGGKNVVTLQN